MVITPALRRFTKYFIIGGATLLFDLGMLYAAVTFLSIPYYIATPFSFLIAVSCNYGLSRHFVFAGTERTWHGGYVYFALVALCGAALTTVLVAALVSFLGFYFLLARIIVAGVIGMANYLFNLHMNFKVAGKHHTTSP